MRDKNRVEFMGHVGQDPEIFTFPSGEKKASFSIATNHIYKDKAGEKQKVTHWHDIFATGSLAEVVEKYVKKGARLEVECKHWPKSYKDKEGKDRVSHEFKLYDLNFLDTKLQTSKEAIVEETPGAAPADDDLPF